MASQTKARGKARRKARRTAKVEPKQDESVTNAPVRRVQSSQISDESMNVRTPARCNHGLGCNTPNNMPLCKWFLQMFVNEFDGASGDFLAAYHATKEKCSAVWTDAGMMKFVVSFLLACGTGKVMEGNIKFASKYAALASYFQQYAEVELLHTRAFPNWPKIRELYTADEHTLVSFLRNRIPCSCLDEKYEEVKSIPKIGLCCNPDCPLPYGKTERSATMCCSQCGAANYCSRECQVAAWNGHMSECAFYTELQAKFQRRKQIE